MTFTVKHEDIYHLLWDMKEKIDNQNTAIDNLKSVIQSFIDYDDFKGANAVASKAYMKEVHLNLLEAMKASNQSLMDSFVRYKVGYYQLESISDESGFSTGFELPEEYMNLYAKVLGDKVVEVVEARSNAIDAISKIVSNGNVSSYELPNTDVLSTTNGNLISSITTLVENIGSHEDSTVTDLTGNAEAMIAYIEQLIAAIQADGGYSNSYVSGSFTGTDAGSALVSATNALNSAHNQNADYYNQVWGIEDNIRENAAAREEMGVWQVIGGVGLVVGGVVCIVCTAGAATPIVAAGWGLGLATVGFGVADGIEGAHNQMLGYDGNLDATAFNAIKQGVFQGNEKAYQATEGIVAFGAAAMCPIGSMSKTNLLTGRRAAVAVGKLAISTGSGYGASQMTANYTDNQTLIMLSGMAASTLTGFGLNAIDKGVGISTHKVDDAHVQAVKDTFNDLSSKESWNTPQQKKSFLATFDDYAERAVRDGACATKEEFYEMYAKRNYSYDTTYVDEIKSAYTSTGASSVVNGDDLRRSFQDFNSMGRGDAGNFTTSIAEDTKLCFGSDKINSDRVALVKGVEMNKYDSGMFQYSYDTTFVQNADAAGLVQIPNGTTGGASSLNIPGMKTWGGANMKLSETEMMMPAIDTTGIKYADVMRAINSQGYYEITNPVAGIGSNSQVINGSVRIIKMN